MNAFSRSWYLTKLSWRVLMADKEMLLFPLLAGIFSLIFGAALLVPTVVASLLAQDGGVALSVIDYVATFLFYLVLAFMATFFNVCTVYTAKVRFEGGDATFMQSIGFAFSRIHLIFYWSLVSATVGLLLYMLDRLAERIGGIGEILLKLLRSLLGMTWSVITIFVVPAMVYREVGPHQAIKESIETVKRTWGESLIRHYGLGFVQGVLFFIGGLVVVGLAVVTAANSALLLVVIGCGVAYFVSVFLIFKVLNSVFNTALYVYAETGNPPTDYDPEIMQHAFRTK